MVSIGNLHLAATPDETKHALGLIVWHDETFGRTSRRRQPLASTHKERGCLDELQDVRQLTSTWTSQAIPLRTSS
jgi:hypothetical protein